jgi:hypothetical protein
MSIIIIPGSLMQTGGHFTFVYPPSLPKLARIGGREQGFLSPHPYMGDSVGCRV